MIQVIIHICPECKRLHITYPEDDGVILASQVLCTDDHYPMKAIAMDEMAIGKLLLGEGTPQCP